MTITTKEFPIVECMEKCCRYLIKVCPKIKPKTLKENQINEINKQNYLSKEGGFLSQI